MGEAEMRRSQRKTDGKLNVAVIGYGKMGRLCVEELRHQEAAQPAGVVRREPGSSSPAGVPFVSHVSELGKVDAALVCVPTADVLPVAHDLLQHRIPVVECATLHGEDFEAHRGELDRMSLRFETPAIIGAGWDPGAVGIFRELFALLIPRGETGATWRTGAALHHTSSGLRGVRKALTAEVPRPGGKQRYLYVELEKGARAEDVEKAAAGEPLFADEETVVIPVDDLAELEEGHGLLLERRGSGGCRTSLLLEARYEEPLLAARMMVASVRALPGIRHGGARTLFEIPLRLLADGFGRFV
jgi:diaminopimelate dehydrogenase